MLRTVLTGLILLINITINAQKIPSMKMDEVVAYFSKTNDTVYVINFWATFCKPCVAELPYVQNIALKYKTSKVKLLLVSVDLKSYYPDKITTFAKKKNIRADIAWLNETNADYFCPMIDTAWSGSIPATLFVNSKTGYKYFFEGEMKAVEFEEALLKAIKN